MKDILFKKDPFKAYAELEKTSMGVVLYEESSGGWTLTLCKDHKEYDIELESPEEIKTIIESLQELLKKATKQSNDK